MWPSDPLSDTVEHTRRLMSSHVKPEGARYVCEWEASDIYPTDGRLIELEMNNICFVCSCVHNLLMAAGLDVTSLRWIQGSSSFCEIGSYYRLICFRPGVIPIPSVKNV
ncbi:hypothetical protein OUZ56_008457 [Daphnia magna]|uniref:Uncharacterized protein n=1 Tax=Daphnia magna TaxID=35525 RepID=A0ABR0AD92_9CRUS|nr:hypothetical protein OUZ56_008457 [Daphnia magna]